MEGVDCSILHTILFWDGPIVASATAAWCAEWIPENPADGQIIEGLVVRNPFRCFSPLDLTGADPSAVGGVDIEDLHVPVCVIDPVGEGEIAGDGNLELPAGIVKVRGIRQRKGIAADRGNGVAKVFARF